MKSARAMATMDDNSLAPASTVMNPISEVNSLPRRKQPSKKPPSMKNVKSRNHRIEMEKQVAEEQIRSKEQIEQLLLDKEELTRENERLKRVQESRYGVQLDDVERMKKELEHAKTTRAMFLEDIETRKHNIEKLEREVFEMHLKVKQYQKENHEMRKAKQEWINTKDRLTRTEVRCKRLLEINRRLKILLLKNHIDITDAEKLPAQHATNVGRNLDGKKRKKHEHVKTVREKIEDAKKDSSHSFSHTAKFRHAHSKSLEDLANIDPDDRPDVRRRRPAWEKKSKDSPNLGYYTRIHHNKMNPVKTTRSLRPISDPVLHLPRVAYVAG